MAAGGLVSQRENPSHFQAAETTFPAPFQPSKAVTGAELQRKLPRGAWNSTEDRENKNLCRSRKRKPKIQLLEGWGSCRELPCACLWVRTASGLGTCLLCSCVGPTWLGLGRASAATLVLGLDVGLLDTLDRSCWDRGTLSPRCMRAALA